VFIADDGRHVEWIPKGERMPTEADGDPWGCVLIYDRLNGVKITGLRNVLEIGRSMVTHWARIPRGPEDK
jgi:hypothetical protein